LTDKNSNEHVLESLNIRRVILPMFIGISVVFYLIYTQIDFDNIKDITWTGKSFFFLFLGILAYVFRHIFYAWRLRIITNKFFSWLKSIELIFIWEFSSSISPTSVGGSAVALFLLAQEKLSGAKTISLVVYTAILDGLFFLISLVLLYLFLGPIVIRPGMQTMQDIDGYGQTFYILLFVMFGYTFLFFYGIFINPRHLKRLMIWASRVKIFKRFRKRLFQNATEIEATSAAILHENWKFHLLSILSTSGAWGMRFLAINFLILAVHDTCVTDWLNQFIIYGRGETMYVITSFSPTPGASGVAEYLFAGFYTDYMPEHIAVIVAIVWRLVTYYTYLFAGMIIVPNWIRKIVNRMRK